jgi:hypothetical protein
MNKNIKILVFIPKNNPCKIPWKICSVKKVL